MMEQGDSDTLRPLFTWMRSTLPLAEARTRAWAAVNPAYKGNRGAFWPETQWTWGVYEPIDYCEKFTSRSTDFCQAPQTVGDVGSSCVR